MNHQPMVKMMWITKIRFQKGFNFRTEPVGPNVDPNYNANSIMPVVQDILICI